MAKMIKKFFQIYVVQWAIFQMAVGVFLLSTLTSSRQDLSPKPKPQVQRVEHCYGEYAFGRDTLRCFFLHRDDSLLIAATSKLSDAVKVEIVENPFEAATYFIGKSRYTSDTVRIKRNRKDLSITRSDVIEFQTYAFPTVFLDSSHYMIRHAAISTDGDFRFFERFFYFTKGEVCPDSITAKEDSFGLFVYD